MVELYYVRRSLFNIYGRSLHCQRFVTISVTPWESWEGWWHATAALWLVKAILRSLDLHWKEGHSVEVRRKAVLFACTRLRLKSNHSFRFPVLLNNVLSKRFASRHQAIKIYRRMQECPGWHPKWEFPSCLWSFPHSR